MSDKKYHQALTANRKLLAENARLKAEVERLQQERNELAVMINPIVLKAWMNLNAAKEGKPSV